MEFSGYISILCGCALVLWALSGRKYAPGLCFAGFLLLVCGVLFVSNADDAKHDDGKAQQYMSGPLDMYGQCIGNKAYILAVGEDGRVFGLTPLFDVDGEHAGCEGLAENGAALPPPHRPGKERVSRP